MIKVNESAPVVAKGKIEINANIETVWNVIFNVKQWPDWNQDIKSVSLDGEITEGSKFRWKTGSGTITSTVQKVDKPKFMAWTGRIMGIAAVHVYKLDMKNSKTIVNTEESWNGLLAHVFQGYMHRTLQNSIDRGLQYLKDESERRYLSI